MVSTYKIKNPDNGNVIELNEIVLLQILKVLKSRNKPLYNIVKKKYENLHDEIFKDSILKF